MSLIDSHCHLYYEPFVSSIEQTLEDCKKFNISKLLSIGVNLKTSEQNIILANKYKNIFCTIGIHPNETNKSKISDIEKLELIYNKNNKILGIGEIGLDYFRSNNKADQEKFFEKQILLALKLNLPIIVHTRDAEDDTIRILKKYTKDKLKFVIHCFSGSQKFADNIIELNGMISFSGIITFKNSDNLRNICKNLPLKNLLIETDSPYLSPHPHRGKVNSPCNVRYVAQAVSEVKNISIEEVANTTSKNFNSFFENL